VSERRNDETRRIPRTLLAAFLGFCLVLGAGWIPVRAAAGPSPPRVRGNNGTSLKGNARTSAGRPVVGASVRIRPDDHPGEIVWTSTDRQGTFRTLKLPDGTYQVAIFKDRLQAVVKEGIRVQFPFRPVVEVEMPPAARAGEKMAAPAGDQDAPAGTIRLEGVLKTLEGDPVPDGTVRLTPVEAGRNPVRTRSGEEGRFRLPGMEAGDWLLEVHGIGFLPIRGEISLAESTELVILLVPQPPGHKLSPLDLLPEEIPVPPSVPLRPQGGRENVDPALRHLDSERKQACNIHIGVR